MESKARLGCLMLSGGGCAASATGRSAVYYTTAQGFFFSHLHRERKGDLFLHGSIRFALISTEYQGRTCQASRLVTWVLYKNLGFPQVGGPLKTVYLLVSLTMFCQPGSCTARSGGLIRLFGFKGSKVAQVCCVQSRRAWMAYALWNSLVRSFVVRLLVFLGHLVHAPQVSAGRLTGFHNKRPLHQELPSGSIAPPPPFSLRY